MKDSSGALIRGARVEEAGLSSVLTGDDGCVELSGASAGLTIRVSRDGFVPVTRTVTASPETDVTLATAAAQETVQVTASRVPLAVNATASSVLSLSKEQIQEAPGLTLDDALREVAGFQLFRRTSSWVANPTIQGTSLRGLGSTAASRTLVLSDEVPLNDAFGGWIYWDEIPALAVEGVEVMRGGASDLYGSSAIGGVIDVLPVVPNKNSLAIDMSGASEHTLIVNGLATGRQNGWRELAAATIFRTAGYVLTDPKDRGAVDVPANVHSQSGRLEFRKQIGVSTDVFLRGNLIDEARDNGTPVQTNATRVWRYAAGGDWTGKGRVFVRIYGSDQNYRQSFSAIATDRNSERLTKLQRVPAQQVGGALQWARTYRQFTLVAGGDLLDTRATDNETPVATGRLQATQSTSARQRQGGAYGEVLWQPQGWSVAFSSRVDKFMSFDARQISKGTRIELPSADQGVFDPRMGVVRQVGGGVSLTGSVFRAFRGPTMNELYRTGQVGQQITQANPTLQPERATGFEAGALFNREHLGSMRASYFWTEVNRPVAAITLSSTPTLLLEKRENLGQLRSRGVSVESELHPRDWMTLTTGYQFAYSTVTKFQANPALVGKWTAQVPRNTFTAQLRMERIKVGVLSLNVRASGQQFDDSANVYRLAGYGEADVYAEHAFHRWHLYFSAQNVLNHSVEAGRTPVLTLGSPRVLAGGVRFR